MGVNEKYELWRKKVKEPDILRELTEMTKEQIEGAFSGELEFGTAGIRAVMGAGTNRLNVYTVRKISQGVAVYMRAQNMRKVVVSYDSRINSQRFAMEACCVFAAMGFNAVITTSLMPSPFLSFATRRLKADIGIMITASHNSKEYNGYKVYDGTGCQIRDLVAKEIAKEIAKVDGFRLRRHTFAFYRQRNMIGYVNEKVEKEFLDEVGSVFPAEAKLNVAYTPLCGTGYRLIPEALKGIGCTVFPVSAQMEPNGKFPTCPIPNPEKVDALTCGIKVMRENRADLLIASDPDADRVGAAYIDGGEVVTLNGNEMGILMADYLLNKYSGSKTPVIVRTLVSTDLVDRIAADHNAKVVVVPTGFKYIGEVINNLNETSEQFLLGFEESQGYLIGTHVRDKDAVVASKILAQLVCELKSKGLTPHDRLRSLYLKYGFYANAQFTYKFEGVDAKEKIEAGMKMLREKEVPSIGGRTLISKVDYLDGGTGHMPMNMLSFNFDGGKVIVRPSGTEPLIKIYALVHVGENENAKLMSYIEEQFRQIF